MKTHVDFSSICTLFKNAENQRRNYLFEHEVYDLIYFSGSETPPAYIPLPRNTRVSQEELDAIPGDSIVMKCVSPYILHKSDLGGVRIVSKNVKDVLSTMRRMYSEIPVTYTDQLLKSNGVRPNEFVDLTDEAIQTAVSASMQQVILCQYMHPDSHEFGNELLVSLRYTREFGMILSAGLGGRDTELYAQRFKKGEAVVAASTQMVNGKTFFELFKKTISYKKLAGLTRGQKRIVSDEQLLECFYALIEVGNYFSPHNSSAPFIIEEMEINPFAFSNYLMLPLDGLCSFSKPKPIATPRPIKNIHHLLHPRSITIIGVSSKINNIGRIIMDNILEMGYPKKQLTLIHPKARIIDSIVTLPDLDALEKKTDLLILAVESRAIPHLLEQTLTKGHAESVVIIPGGYGEAIDQELSLKALQTLLSKSRLSELDTTPLILGGNSLGVFSSPGGYDGLFIPESKLPRKGGTQNRRSALVSQSGAYMITRMSKLSFLTPAYAVSIGNQIDLTAGDFLHFFNNIENLETIAFYMEGFTDLDGLSFSMAVKEATLQGKDIIFYKAGRTPEGKSALAGHTSSIAGDYMVCESCIGQAGAFVAETFAEFEGLLRLSRTLHGKDISGRRLAALSNAGYESVGIADNILGEGFSLSMASFQEKTKNNLQKIINDSDLESLVSIDNPIDITPMASEKVYIDIIRNLLEDNGVDAVIVAIVPLTPILHTLPEENIADDTLTAANIVDEIAELNVEFNKPLVIVLDSGSLYDHMANDLEDKGLPVFRSADHAVRVLGKYIETRCIQSTHRYKQNQTPPKVQ